MSTEPDYFSLSAAVAGRADFFERNLVATGSLGFARDRISPTLPPAGEHDLWPAHHDRVFIGLSLSQVLGPRTIVAGSLTMSHQAGSLENPYRRVRVRTTLFPERVPDVRQRLTGAVALSQYLGHGFAGHLRNGMYSDDWNVLAWVPEVAVAWAPLPRALLDVHARWYSQTSARFYAPHYDDLAPELTADVRLGRLEERSVGVHADVQIVAQSSGIGALHGNGGYDLSALRYLELDRDVTGHLLILGLRWLP